jgi:hypothetical protein
MDELVFEGPVGAHALGEHAAHDGDLGVYVVVDEDVLLAWMCSFSS